MLIYVAIRANSQSPDSGTALLRYAFAAVRKWSKPGRDRRYLWELRDGRQRSNRATEDLSYPATQSPELFGVVVVGLLHLADSRLSLRRRFRPQAGQFATELA